MEIYFAKHKRPDGSHFFTTVEAVSRVDAVKYLNVYNKSGDKIIGCRRRVLVTKQYHELIKDISGPDTLREQYFERML